MATAKYELVVTGVTASDADGLLLGFIDAVEALGGEVGGGVTITVEAEKEKPEGKSSESEHHE